MPDLRAGLAQAWLRPENLDHPVGRGTLAAVLRAGMLDGGRGALYGLTAGHVLGGDPQSGFGNRVGVAALGEGDAVLYGRAHSWSPDLTRTDRRVAFDAGLLSLDEAALGAIADQLEWPLGWAEAAVGDEVRLLTRHHHLPGRVLGRVDTAVDTGDPPVRYQLTDVLCCEIDGGSLPGDSGAPLWDLQDRLVGLLVGQAPEGSAGNAIVTPIDRVLAWSGCELVLRGQPLLAPDEGRGAVDGAPAAPAPPSLPPSPSRAVDLMARTMWGEARGEPDARLGMGAVGHVLFNRCAARSWWGRTVEEVCLFPQQFSCWNENDPNRPQLAAVTEADAIFALAGRVARELFQLTDDARRLADPTNGATHYHTQALTPPAWTVGATLCARIGHHVFYRNVG